MGGNSLSALSPRQRMINMMYLVLTALLALNVSVEVLEAFVTVNRGLEETNRNFTRKTQVLYNQLHQELTFDSLRVVDQYEKAQEAKELTEDMVSYVEHLKNVLIAFSEGEDTTNLETTWRDNEGNRVTGMWSEKPLAMLKSRDSYIRATRIMAPGGDENPERGYGYNLKRRIDQFRGDLENIFDPEEEQDIIESLNLGLNTDDIYSHLAESYRSWQTFNFYKAILAANVVTLNRIIAEIRNAEAEVVGAIMSQIRVTDFTFDRVEAYVIPESNYIMSGQEYEAQILVAAMSETQTPEVYILEGVDTASHEQILSEGTRISDTATVGGVTRYRTRPGGLGERTYAGLIRLQKAGTPGDKPEDFNLYSFSSSYMVAQPAATIAATAVNVFYRGVDNPLEVSAPGVAAANLSVSASNASISGSAGSYNVRPGQGHTSTINVSARMPDGSTRAMGSMEFRVRNLPRPTLQMAGKSSGDNITATELTRARLFPRQDALIEANYSVTGFQMSVTVGNRTQSYNATGDRLTQEMQNMVNNLPRGSVVRFSNIRARGPDGSIPLDGIFFNML